MKEGRLSDMASDPRFISGIYNYCDRWCERCRFTHRCMVFAMEHEMSERDRPGADGIIERPSREQSTDDEAFEEMMADLDPNGAEDDDEGGPFDDGDWDLDAILGEEDEEEDHWMMFGDDDGDDDADDDPIIPEELDPIERKIRKEQIDRHPCCTLSFEYVGIASDAMKELHGAIRSKPEQPTAGENTELQDAMKIVTWYRFFIHAKLKRAVWGMFNDALDGFDDMPRDFEGSAKIALIAIENSITAWKTLTAHVPSRRNSIQSIINHLETLGEKTETAFPGAPLFVRPGFDTEEPPY